MKFLKIGCVVFGLALFAGNAASAEQRPVTLMSGLGIGTIRFRPRIRKRRDSSIRDCG
jgi:hypothetical protein